WRVFDRRRTSTGSADVSVTTSETRAVGSGLHVGDRDGPLVEWTHRRGDRHAGASASRYCRPAVLSRSRLCFRRTLQRSRRCLGEDRYWFRGRTTAAGRIGPSSRRPDERRAGSDTSNAWQLGVRLSLHRRPGAFPRILRGSSWSGLFLQWDRVALASFLCRGLANATI